MKALLRGLLHFIQGTIQYWILHKGPGEFSKNAIVIPINSHRFSSLPGRRRKGMNKKLAPAKVIVLSALNKNASSN